MWQLAHRRMHYCNSASTCDHARRIKSLPLRADDLLSMWWKLRAALQRSYPQRLHRPPSMAMACSRRRTRIRSMLVMTLQELEQYRARRPVTGREQFGRAQIMR